MLPIDHLQRFMKMIISVLRVLADVFGCSLSLKMKMMLMVLGIEIAET